MANPQIGTCPCPMKGCEEVMAVKKFAARTDNAIKQRKAGKLYADGCPVHGRIGGDGSQAMQDYLLDKGDLWNDEELAAHHEAARVAELERKQAQIQRQPAGAGGAARQRTKRRPRARRRRARRRRTPTYSGERNDRKKRSPRGSARCRSPRIARRLQRR